MSEAPAETPTNPPDTSSPNAPQTPNENPQEPNVNPNPAAPQNPATSPATPSQNPADLLAELRALPERLANVLNERSPKPTEKPAESQTSNTNSETNVTGPNGKGDPWDVRFARAWFGN